MDDEAAGRVRRTVREERRRHQRRQEISILKPTEQRGEESSKLREGGLDGEDRREHSRLVGSEGCSWPLAGALNLLSL